MSSRCAACWAAHKGRSSPRPLFPAGHVREGWPPPTRPPGGSDIQRRADDLAPILYALRGALPPGSADYSRIDDMAASLQAAGSAMDAERASVRIGLEQAEVVRSRLTSFESSLRVRGLRPGITVASGRKSYELGQIRRTLQRDFGPENVSAGKVGRPSARPRVCSLSRPVSRCLGRISGRKTAGASPRPSRAESPPAAVGSDASGSRSGWRVTRDYRWLAGTHPVPAGRPARRDGR